MFLVTREACGLKSKGVVGVENDRWYRRASERAGKEADLLGGSGSDGWRINWAVNGKTGVAARCRGGPVMGGEALGSVGVGAVLGQDILLGDPLLGSLGLPYIPAAEDQDFVGVKDGVAVMA
jgi:hypothetical protein